MAESVRRFFVRTWLAARRSTEVFSRWCSLIVQAEMREELRRHEAALFHLRSAAPPKNESALATVGASRQTLPNRTPTDALPAAPMPRKKWAKLPPKKSSGGLFACCR